MRIAAFALLAVAAPAHADPTLTPITSRAYAIDLYDGVAQNLVRMLVTNRTKRNSDADAGKDLTSV